ncbi:hypothetical protein FHS25_007335 [Rhizobium laguerreae]|uniref:Uncharacterized protein n=1 Tax=Rhizobium laguerreae TaxID=1076926 RepID=A0ABR6GKI3_9HYPH|nr:hypothetical protein [Rhizobium laguerreae]
MKTIAIVIASLIAFSGIGHAADIIAPVKEIIVATKSNWADNDSDWTDIFDASRLDHLYSRDFVAKYQAAAQLPAVAVRRVLQRRLDRSRHLRPEALGPAGLAWLRSPALRQCRAVLLAGAQAGLANTRVVITR